MITINFLNNINNDYDSLMSKGDPRVKNWPLVQSPFPTVFLCITQLYFVKKVGPAFMQNRKPYNVKYLLILYNVLMVILNSYIFFSAGAYGWFGKYSFKCQPMDYSYEESAIGMAKISWFYFISKFIDFFDTCFFIVKKKFSHVSNLHVIHHSLMPIIVWSGLKFAPGMFIKFNLVFFIDLINFHKI